MKRGFIVFLGLISLIASVLSITIMASAAEDSRYFSDIREGETRTFVVEKENIPVYEVTLSFNRERQDAWLETQSFTKLPETIMKIDTSDVLYRYINFRENGFTEDELSYFSFDFFVPKSWSNKHKVSGEGINLYSYVDGTWRPKDVDYDGESNEAHLFSASGSPGLYLITGEPDTMLVPIETKDSVSVIGAAAVIPGEVEGNNYAWVVAILIIGIIISVLFLRKGNEAEEEVVNVTSPIQEMNMSGLDVSEEEFKRNDDDLKKELRL
jgi:PGF-pre-PGF domain-containing protein